MVAEIAPSDGLAGRVLAMREIKRLQHIWCHLIEAGRWTAAADLFAEDGIWLEEGAQYRGRSALADYFSSRAGLEGEPARRFEFRPMLSPVITISEDGYHASGRWREICLSGQAGVSADWSGGCSLVDYRKSGGVWLIAEVRHYRQFAGSYEGGWHNAQADAKPVPFRFLAGQIGAPFGTPFNRDAQDQNLATVLLGAGEAQNLTAAFGFYADRGAHADIADLFSKRATVSIDGEIAARGRAEIESLLGRLMGPAGTHEGVLNDRIQFLPVTTIGADGATAHVRAYEIAMTGRHRGEAHWSLTIQDFRCEADANGAWRIAALDRTPRMRAAYCEGWGVLPREAAGRQAYPFAQAPRPAFSASLIAESDSGPRHTRPGALQAAAAFDCAENAANAYGYYIDEYMWDEAADLFATDGWKELSYIGTYIGRERVRLSMKSRYGNSGRRAAFMALHQTVQPYVTVASDAKRARIRLRLFQFNSQQDLDGSWILGVYENQMVFEDEAWRIHGMDLEYEWLGDYAGGWAEIDPARSERFRPSAETIAAYPPDAPLRGEAFAPFPSVAPLGFHFRNPVSGREPDWLLPWSDGHHQEGAQTSHTGTGGSLA